MRQAFACCSLFVLSACVGDPVTPDGGTGGPDGGSQDGTTTTDTGTDGSSGDSASNDGMPLWDPSQLPTLVLWLDADTALKNVNGTTDVWKDKSSFKTDAKANAQIQQPVVIAPGQGINNHQTLRFDGANTYLTIPDAPSLQWKQFVFEIVFRHAVASASEGGAMFAKTNGMIGATGAQIYLSTGLTQPFNAQVEFSTSSGKFVTYNPSSPIDGNGHRLRAQYDGNTMTLQIDSAAPLTLAAGSVAVDQVGKDVYIGKVPGYPQFVKCEIAEIVVLSGMNIPPADVTKLQAYLDTKYGL